MVLFSQLQAISLNFQTSGAKAISTLVKHSPKIKRGVSQIAALASVLGAWRPIARHIILQREMPRSQSGMHVMLEKLTEG
jgi:hypothetical protein